MKASAPSMTALATSVASARVGRGLLPIVSTSRVMITGLPCSEYVGSGSNYGLT